MSDVTAKPLVILPTYNEKDNLPEIIPQVLDVDPRIEILVVDDNSPDGTGELADSMAEENPRIHVHHRKKKQGLGMAYLSGFRWALERDYSCIFEMDADFSHRPDYLKDFLNTVEEYDLIIGSRYLNGVNVINWPMIRLVLSYFANIYTRWVTGLPLKDATGGFKCFRRKVLEAIDFDQIKSDGYSFQIEMSFNAWCKGFTIKEIPIIFYEREVGASKMSKKIVREAIWMVWRLRLKKLFGMYK
ncbi:MAG: polyprenol monophosphomannose synthase [candidate division Zixibacteria bacterium]|nr:polyprenol monophosphomannose synthase [candidate division Zixibacteria bacterium]